jgi:hypothetical protein
MKGERVEQRKAGFKSKLGTTHTDRGRKNEQLRKEKRSGMILAKRLKTGRGQGEGGGEGGGEGVGEGEGEGGGTEGGGRFGDAYLAEALLKTRSGESGVRYEGLRMVRRLLCSAQPRIAQLIQAGVVPLAAQVLVCPNEDLRLEAAWCLTNIATGDHR